MGVVSRIEAWHAKMLDFTEALNVFEEDRPMFNDGSCLKQGQLPKASDLVTKGLPNKGYLVYIAKEQ
jgi:hypothetical protein